MLHLLQMLLIKYANEKTVNCSFSRRKMKLSSTIRAYLVSHIFQVFVALPENVKK